MFPTAAFYSYAYPEPRGFRDWKVPTGAYFDAKLAEGRWFLDHATQVKNIWVPYGE